MTTTDATKILERLAVIETLITGIRVDAEADRMVHSEHQSRIRRLELIVVAMLATWGADAAGLPTPFS